MAPKCQTPYESRVKIITLHQEGNSVRQISKKLKISISEVVKTIHRHRDTGTYDDHPLSGTPRKLLECQEKCLAVTCKHNRFKAVCDLIAELNKQGIHQ